MICFRWTLGPGELPLVQECRANDAASRTLPVPHAAAGMGIVVLEAFAITSLVFVALTIFAIKSKVDFSFLGAILPLCLLVLMIWGLFAMFAFDSRFNKQKE